MATAKTTTLTFRIEPGLKDVLRMAADREHRSITNMVEVMIGIIVGGTAPALPQLLPTRLRGDEVSRAVLSWPVAMPIGVDHV